MELSSFSATYGVLAIFVVMLLKEIGVPIPVPSDLLMVGAGVQLATGAYSAVALLLALAGLAVWLWMRRRGGGLRAWTEAACPACLAITAARRDRA